MEWNREQEIALRELKLKGLRVAEIASAMGRTSKSIQHKWDEIKGIPLCDIGVHITGELHTILVYGDVHIPFQDDKAVDLMIQVSKAIVPNIIIINGDLIDFYSISSFRKLKPDAVRFKEELNMAIKHLEMIRNLHPQAQIIFNMGNHEDRLPNYLADNAQELMDLNCLDVYQLLEMDRLKIALNRAVNRESYQRVKDNLLIGHFAKCCKFSAYTAKALIESKGISLIQGHTHRLGSHYRTWVKREVVGMESGCLCSLTPEYLRDPDWQQGFCVVTLCDKYFRIQDIPIIRDNGHYIAIYGDKFYKE